ncbi:Conserved hypothetical protein [Geotrichum candidum]|uniref:IMS import disulfide relay-system CHCH-CHCH-like Cx9C domain-containing protein n=1 Tax=Geotrichum candidum TaxID=1173061 RepID=A0A0J9X686_GEOCN|nr:Conserved hypothetical protein [Geotrichum candidum]
MNRKAVERPLKKFADASMKCNGPATVYGQCVLKNYTATSKDMCLKEFMQLKDCVQRNLGKKW